MTDELVAWLRGVLGEDERRLAGTPGYVLRLRRSTRAFADWMLADIEAKRAILDRCEQYGRWAANDAAAGFQALKSAGEVIVRLLASAYRDRPGYRSEWRP